jgi:cystathionine beta-lyase
MQYNFDKIIDRRHDQYSYSAKWTDSPRLAEAFDIKEINDDTIGIYTADMDFACAQPILDALHGVVDHGIFGYSMLPDHGYREAIIGWFKRRHNFDILPEEIVYVNGTVEALKQIILAFTNPGEGIIIQRPVYGPFSQIITSTGRNIVDNKLIEGADLYYTIDFEDLEEKCKDPNNKMLFLCSPHNPVGRIWKEEELILLANICRQNDVIIVSDEVHCDLNRKEAVFHPLATLVDNSNIITATAASKTFNLAGLHCTNLFIKNTDLRKKLYHQLGHISPTPFTIAATMAAYNHGEEWLTQVTDYIDSNIDWVLQFLKERMPKVKCRRPEGTYIIWMDFRAYGLSAEEIHDRIYNKAGVILEGGLMFDPDNGSGFERACLPSPRSVLQSAFERIAAQFED